jgi:hypothetical protein
MRTPEVLSDWKLKNPDFHIKSQTVLESDSNLVFCVECLHIDLHPDIYILGSVVCSDLAKFKV